MFIFIAEFEVKVGQSEAYKAQFQQRHNALMGTLDGFTQDTLTVKPDDPHQFVVTSAFANETALQGYQTSDAMKTYLGNITPLMSQIKSANLYTISNVKSMMPPAIDS